MKKAAIIIANWNGEKLLKTCLKAVFNQTYKNFKVYFVDNGSVDNSVEIVKNSFKKVKIIKLGENTGFAKGSNIGIKKAFDDKEIKYIVCLNNDTKVDKNWLKELVISIEKDKKVGMVASKSFFSNGKIQNSGLFVSFINVESSGGKARGYNESSNKFNKEEYIFAPSGCSALYKREMLEEIGLFDEDFFAYSEDSDLGLRAQLAGWKCLYNPKSQLVHYHSKTSGGPGSSFKAFHTKRNGMFEALKNYSWPDFLKYMLREFWIYFEYLKAKNKNQSVSNLNDKVGLRSIIFIVFKVYWSFILNLPKMLRKRFNIQKNKKINKKEYKDLFLKFSNEKK